MPKQLFWTALIALVVAIIGVATLVTAQQMQLQLGDGDEVSIECPTALTVEFGEEGATVSCQLPADEPAADEPAAEETATDVPAEP